jgi:hypothetical protein
MRGFREGTASEPNSLGFSEQAHELLDSGDLLPVRPERHYVLEFIEAAHVTLPAYVDIALSLKGVIQGSDVSKLVTLDIL